MSDKTELSAEELDRKFDAGEDMSAHLDWASARRPGREQLAGLLRETRNRLWNEVQRLDQAIREIEGHKPLAKS